MNFAYLGREDPHEGLANELLFNSPPRMLACDIETPSLKDKRIIGIGLSDEHGNAFYFPTYPEPSSYLQDVLNILNNPAVIKLWHNGLFDIPALMEQYGVVIGAESIMDSMIMAQLAGYSSKLTELALECGTQAQDMKRVLDSHKAKTTLELPLEVLAGKCCTDVQATFACYKHLSPLIDMDYVREEMKLIPIIIKMQLVGLVIDHDMCQSIGDRLLADAAFYKSICKDEGFNPASSMQVGYILAKRGHHQVIGRKDGKMVYKTDEKKVLSKIDDPLVTAILGYRHAAKEYSTYIKPWEGKDRIYTHFSFETATRRLASADLNLQNVPKHLRKMILGPFSGFDFSQQEYRTLAYISNDRVMLDVFARGEDLHQATANFMGIPRKVAKNVSFAMMYGGSPQTIADTAGIADIERAKELRHIWASTYPQAVEWIEDIQVLGLAHKRVPTLFGAWLRIREEKEEKIRKCSVNYSIQGSAAELTKRAMIRCSHLPMVLQIHDELMFIGDVREEITSLDLAHIGPFETPIELKYSLRWGDE